MEAAIVAAIFAGTMLPIAIVAWREATGRRNEAVRAATAEANATSYASQLADTANRLQEANQRADAIEDAWVAAAATEPVAGAADRLLAAIAAARAARGDGARGLPADAAAAEPRRGDLELLRPGE